MIQQYRRLASFITVFLLCLIAIQFTACTKKADLQPSQEVTASQEQILKSTKKTEKKTDLDEFAMGIAFAQSFEAEMLRLVAPTFSGLNQFQILLSALDGYRQKKRTSLAGYDCQRLEIFKMSDSMYELHSLCLKKPIKLLQFSKIKTTTAQNQIQNQDQSQIWAIDFENKEWLSIVGASTAITQPQRHCEMTLDTKLKNNSQTTEVVRLFCDVMVYALQIDRQVEELKMTKYLFEKGQPREVTLEGGLFKDLVLVKKINLSVPLQGKIKIFEKNIKVHDDFENYESQYLDRKNNLTSEGNFHEEKNEIEKQNQKTDQNEKNQNINKIENQSQSQVENQSENPNQGQNSGEGENTSKNTNENTNENANDATSEQKQQQPYGR